MSPPTSNNPTQALKAFTRGAKANPSNEVIKGRAAAVRAKLRELERERYVADQVGASTADLCHRPDQIRSDHTAC
jgi:hypothetical protein